MNKDGIPQGSVQGPTPFLLHINDLPAVINKKPIPILFAEYTSILCIHSNFMEFHVNIETILTNVNMLWKKCLSLNIKRTRYIHFKTKNSQPIDISMCLNNNKISKNIGLPICSFYILRYWGKVFIKVSAISCWLSVVTPSIFRNLIFVLFIFLCVSLF